MSDDLFNAITFIVLLLALIALMPPFDGDWGSHED